MPDSSAHAAAAWSTPLFLPDPLPSPMMNAATSSSRLSMIRSGQKARRYLIVPRCSSSQSCLSTRGKRRRAICSSRGLTRLWGGGKGGGVRGGGQSAPPGGSPGCGGGEGGGVGWESTDTILWDKRNRFCKGLVQVGLLPEHHNQPFPRLDSLLGGGLVQLCTALTPQVHEEVVHRGTAGTAATSLSPTAAAALPVGPASRN